MSEKLVLILNCGSSSLKFSILNPATGEEKLSGLAEAFYLPEARIKWKLHGEKGQADLGAGAAHAEALNFVVNNIFSLDPELQKGVVAIGHRIVHGGEKFTSSVIVTDEVVKGIEDAIQFAPLHNPAHLIGIKEAFKLFPHLKEKNVVVFDTAFHQTMPEEAYLYALPYSLYREHGVRRYGAHGTSHYYVSREAAKRLGVAEDKVNVITCHLGNGASITAVDGGKSVDTSMGFTPLAGVTMGTRSGDIDASLVAFLMNKLNITDVNEMVDILNKKSGLLGLSGVSSDMRDVEAASATNEDAKVAVEIFVDRVQKYIGQYVAVMNGVDAIVFTAGIGENSKTIRARIIDGLTWFGCDIDPERNDTRSEAIISSEGAKVTVLNIPTNEEVEIARDIERLRK